jgi:hypothetical protein
VVDVGRRDHRGHGGVNVSGLELVAAVRFPKCDEIRIAHIALLVYMRMNIIPSSNAHESSNTKSREKPYEKVKAKISADEARRIALAPQAVADPRVVRFSRT